MQDHFEISVLRYIDDVARWYLVDDFLKLRKRVFVDDMSWGLPVHRGREFEQYDRPDAVYVIAHQGKKVIGGARLLATDAVSAGSGKFQYSYMIRDASLGLLEGMPVDMCFDDAPVSNNVWELTRFASVSADRKVAARILWAANDHLCRHGVAECLFLGPPAFLRMAKVMGFEPEAIGPVVGNDDGKFLAFSIPVRAPFDGGEGDRFELMLRCSGVAGLTLDFVEHVSRGLGGDDFVLLMRLLSAGIVFADARELRAILAQYSIGFSDSAVRRLSGNASSLPTNMKSSDSPYVSRKFSAPSTEMRLSPDSQLLN